MVVRGYSQRDKPPDYSTKSVAEWIQILKDTDKQQDQEQFNRARLALGPRGPYAKTAIPALIDALDVDELRFSMEFMDVLAEYGSPAVEPLIHAMKSPKAVVRRGAMGALESMRPRPMSAIPALLEALKDQDENTRYQAIESLAMIGIPGDKATIDLVAKTLNEERVEVRSAMLQVFLLWRWKGGRPAPPAVTPLLVETLKDKNAEMRNEALDVLASMGPMAKDAVPALMEALHSKDLLEHREKIMHVLGCIGPDAKTAVPDLLELVRKDDLGLRNQAVGALGGIGPAAKSAVPEILKVAQGEVKGNRWTAIWALGRIGPDAKEAVPTLLDALKTAKAEGDEHDDVLKALRGIGPAAKAAVPALLEMARDQKAKPSRRKDAARAVLAIDPANPARSEMEIASLSIDHLRIRQGKMPVVKLEPRPAVTEEKKKQIKALIAKLAEIKEPEFYMWVTQTSRCFTPVFGEKSLGLGLATGSTLKSPNALGRLVEMGPDALPFLLEALADKTPTQLTWRDSRAIFSSEVHGNCLNPVERRVLLKARDEDEVTRALDPDVFGLSRTLKIGDVCFAAIGQIVSRPSYGAIEGVGFAPDIVYSPVEVKALRDRVRDIWKSDDPARRLLDSLLFDFAMEDASFNGNYIDWGNGSNYQIEAVVRLLYYFPKETAPLVAARLQALDVKDADADNWKKREAKNGVHAIDLIKAVSWCKEPQIQEALAGIKKRTNDKWIKGALSPSEK
jgi:HEAT repeat protein